MQTNSTRNPIIFETERLTLRQATLDDVQAYLSFWNDPEAMKYIGDGNWGGGKDVVTKSIIKNMSFYETHPGLGFWAVVDKATGNIIGEAGLGLLKETGETEAGYLLSRAHWGRGFGTELLTCLLAYGFSTLRVDHIVAVAHPDNLPSIRIMEKCGMDFVGKVLNDGVWVVKYTQSAHH